MISYKKALKILEEAGCSDSVIEHCIAVSKLATEIGNKLATDGADIDLALVEIGGLLHDLGRAKTHGIRHAIEGAAIAREMGIDNSVVEIIKKHIGAGITADEAIRLELPPDNYIPQTIEEKIVAHADNLIKGTMRISMEERISIMKKSNVNGESIEMLNMLANEIDVY
jgi:uncharacterized protein